MAESNLHRDTPENAKARLDKANGVKEVPKVEAKPKEKSR